MNYEIKSLNDQGQGIVFVNDKITFVDKAVTGDIVEIEITNEYKKYNLAKVIKIIKKSSERVDEFCPYYNECGGCQLQNLKYDDTIKYKKEKLENILKKFANIDYDIEIVKSNKVNYRNKITLKIVNKKIGFYKYNSKDLVEIDKCYIANESINNFINYLKDFNIIDGEVIIRSNYNDELLVNIISKDEITIPSLDNLKIVGILHNNDVMYGENHFMEKINNKFFEVSYDSFFQINRDITSKIFDYIRNNILKNKNVLDLYCGVGTLGINIADISKKVYGIECVENAILNAIKNSKINKVDNTKYMLGDASKIINKIDDKIDVVIVDPPRSGMSKKEIEVIKEMNVEQIIYVSCDPITLSRDLKLLNNQYNIESIKGFDMFPYTYHIECICFLKKIEGGNDEYGQ